MRCLWKGFPLFVVLVLMSGAARADSETLGDVALIGLSAATLGATYFHDDSQGRWMLAKSGAASLGAIFTVKWAFKDSELGERPNGKGYGFPSGHAGVAAAGASFLQGRYGWAWGVPAWIATGYISYVRVEQTHHHRWRDIAAAATIAQASSWYFVDSFNGSTLSLAPMVDGETIGLSVAYQFE